LKKVQKFLILKLNHYFRIVFFSKMLKNLFKLLNQSKKL